MVTGDLVIQYAGYIFLSNIINHFGMCLKIIQLHQLNLIMGQEQQV